MRDFLARLQVDRVSNARGGRNRSHAVCVDLVLGFELRVVVHARLDGIVVERGWLRDLLTSGEGNRVTCAVRSRDWVDGEYLLFLVAEGCGSLRECARQVLFVFERLDASKFGGSGAMSVGGSRQWARRRALTLLQVLWKTWRRMITKAGGLEGR
jgi:hypothetical protein